MKFRILLIMLISINCNSSNKDNSKKPKYFKDVNIYTLKGIDEISSTNYPNIEIGDSLNYRILKYNYSFNNFFRRIYRKESNSWVCNIFVKD
ncbi:MAG: hypothetical protein ACJ748_09725, partial [Flavisolibacter sp.]